jgi:uncharacterized protein YggU (UPF0235/DUF167 family)
MCNIGVEFGALTVAVDAAARDGEANMAVLELLADALGVKRRCLTLVCGGKSREKVVVVDGLSAAEAERRLAAQLSSS